MYDVVAGAPRSNTRGRGEDVVVMLYNSVQGSEDGIAIHGWDPSYVAVRLRVYVVGVMSSVGHTSVTYHPTLPTDFLDGKWQTMK